MRKLFGMLTAAAMATGCASGVDVMAEYRPAVDPEFTAIEKFEADLVSCRAIAAAQYDKYMSEAVAESLAAGLAGALTGAAAGALVGAPYGQSGYGARIGAATGAVVGVSAEAWRSDPKGAAARVVDRCLVNRGHQVLSDLGRG